LAARNGHTEVAKLLLCAGADINMKDNYGQTALEIAQRYGYDDIVELITQEIQARRLRQAKQEVGALAKAAIERLGVCSPAHALAQDRFLLQLIGELGAGDISKPTKQ
jgi:hypothetical protein